MKDNQQYYLRIINIFLNKLHKTFSDQEWEVPTILWTRLTNIIHQSIMLLEEVPLQPWIINLKMLSMIPRVKFLDSQTNKENQKTQNNLLNIKVSSQATISWKFKDHQQFLNFRVSWLRDSEKPLRIEVVEESLVLLDNSKSLMIMVQEILILMNSQKLFKISKFKLKKLILKVYSNLWI